MNKEIKHYKVKQLPSSPTPNSIYWVKASTYSEVSGYITDLQGVPYPLKDISGSGGIQTITNTDGNISIVGANNLVVNISPTLLSVINSALQSGDNISELVNDIGYLTSFTETDPIFQASEASLFVVGDKANLDNQSGINSGDETTLSIQTKRPLKTVNGESLEGNGNVQIDYNDLDNLPIIPTPISNHSGLNLDDGTNPHGTTKSDVGLSNVDNTSDLDKPISTATQNALNGKQANLGYTPENITNKSDSYTANSSTTYASSKALVDGLATKLDKGTYAGTAQSLKNEIDSKQNLLSSFDESILIENDGNIEGNVSLFEEYFEQQECELNFTPIQIVAVYQDGIKLLNSEYEIILPKKIKIKEYVDENIQIQYTHLKS